MPYKPKPTPNPNRVRRAHVESQERIESKKNYQTKEWKRLRAYKKSIDPLCEACLKLGLYTPMYCVDHKRRVRDGGVFLDVDNTQSLCRNCHDIKSGQEAHSRRGGGENL